MGNDPLCATQRFAARTSQIRKGSTFVENEDMCHLHHLLGILLVTNHRIVKEHRNGPFGGPLSVSGRWPGGEAAFQSAPPRNQRIHHFVGRTKYAALLMAYFVRPTGERQVFGR